MYLVKQFVYQKSDFTFMDRQAQNDIGLGLFKDWPDLAPVWVYKESPVCVYIGDVL